MRRAERTAGYPGADRTLLRSLQHRHSNPAATSQLREKQEVSSAYAKGVTALRDFIAPSSLEFNGNHFRIGTRFARTYYVYGYPRQVYTGWLSGMINLDEVIDLSMVIQPVDSQVV